MRGDVGYGKPPVEMRFQKGRSGNPGGRPGPRRVMEKRFQQALADALQAAPEALLAREPGSAFALLAEGLVCRAALADPETILLVMGLLPERGWRARFPAFLVHALESASAADRSARAQSQGISAV